MKAFKNSGVVPDVISSVPDNLLEVDYTKSGKKVDLGNELTPTEVQDIPEVKYDADPDSFYTVIMTDPDAPSRANPTKREYNHWLVVNIPGSNIHRGDAIAEYLGSAPQIGTGLHRYIFIVYKQPGRLYFNEPRHSKMDRNRDNFSTEILRRKYNLGRPIAGNFFRAQFEGSEPRTQFDVSEPRAQFDFFERLRSGFDSNQRMHKKWL